MAVTGAPVRFPASRQWMLHSECNSGFQGGDEDFAEQLVAMTLSDTVFGFLDSGHGSAESSGSERFNDEEEESDEEEDEVLAISVEENKTFWENQHKVLKEILCKSSSVEREIRNSAREALKASNREGGFCVCRRPVVAADGDTCWSCLMREISRRLCDAGYDSAVCKSKWRSSPEIPSGDHTFIEVIDNSNPKKGQVRVIIELNFRAEFEMGRASEEYNQLIARLPEAFVGKAERLKALIKIISSSAKKCMKDKKMHMGPWRKYKYVLAKWFGTCERVDAKAGYPLANAPFPYKFTSKPKASMLTVALHDMMPNARPKVIAVL